MDTGPWARQDPAVSGARARVLIVDDEVAVRRIAERVLGPDYEVVVTSDGDEALEVLAGAPGFALVLLDASMPRMSGRQVLEQMRERGDATPVVMCSGFGDDPADELAAFPNLRGHMPKPYRIAELRERVRAELDPRGGIG